MVLIISILILSGVLGAFLIAKDWYEFIGEITVGNLICFFFTIFAGPVALFLGLMLTIERKLRESKFIKKKVFEKK